LKAGEIPSPLVTLDFADVKVPHTGFKPLVREGRFDFAEVAIVTFLQAKSGDFPYILLPAVTMGRGQHKALVYNSERGPVTVADLPKARVGVRSYAQTTGVWLRGVLKDEYGVASADVRWVTFDDSHVVGFPDPPNCERAPADKNLAGMLESGEIDAAIFGNDLPSDPRLRPVIADAEAEERRWIARHGFVPINHMVVVRESVARAHPEIVRELCRLMAESKRRAELSQDAEFDPVPIGLEANWSGLDVIVRYAREQGILKRGFSVEELFGSAAAAFAR
jgi:4,5-dihydroxyphthalate decarboxylase